MKRVLLACTVPALESYSIGIISAAMLSNRVDFYACVFIAGTDMRTDSELLEIYGIPEHKIDKVAFFRLSENKVSRILSGRKYLSGIRKFAEIHQINTLHFISQDVMLSGQLKQFKNFEVYYTVHDLIAHEVKLSLVQRAKHYYFRIRKDSDLVNRINNLVTNSIHQRNKLEELFPEKNIQLHQMPGLITPQIKKGQSVIKELEGVDNYVLFFGRIEFYKGIDLLYEAFINSKELSNTKLVIAGKGEIYFDRDQDKEHNVLFLNRYIADEEINDLFGKASFFVMPYRSATQSAVSSLAYHYGLPVIASDTEGLTDTILNEKTGLLYANNDRAALINQVLRLKTDRELYDNLQLNIKESAFFYNVNRLSIELEEIYKP